MEWVIILGFVVLMYIVIYKYEKKMDKLHDLIQENKMNIKQNNENISKNRKHIDENHHKLKEHHNYIDRMWVTIPKKKENK